MQIMIIFKKQNGFTLIELLVVISIIGLLSAVAVPRFIDTTATARTAKVQNDLIALDSAIRLFATNNNGTIPSYTKDALGPYLSGGELPTAPSGNYRIDGIIKDISPPVYSINDEDRASVNIDGTDYTATTLK